MFFLKYLIYKSYNWQIKVKSKSPEKAAIYPIILPFMLLILSILFFLSFIFRFHLSGVLFVTAVIIIVLVLENYLSNFIESVGMKNIINECSSNNKNKEIIGSILVILFIFIFTIIPFVVATLLVYKDTEIIW